AYGKPLVDAQHPLGLVMALSVQYAHRLDRDTMLQFYYAPVGEAALGPVAFPRRASAAESRRRRSAITGRIPRISPITSRPSPCVTSGCVWRPADSTAASRTKTGGTSTGAA